MIRAYRLTKTKYVESAFDGEGARLYGGRWNSIGTRMVYTASTLSLATLELLVHLGDVSVLQETYSVVPVAFDPALVTTLDRAELPTTWNSPQPCPETQRIGDEWARDSRSAALAVPSAVTVDELNYLLNPAHADFEGVEILPHFAFAPDPRLGGR